MTPEAILPDESLFEAGKIIKVKREIKIKRKKNGTN